MAETVRPSRGTAGEEKANRPVCGQGGSKGPAIGNGGQTEADLTVPYFNENLGVDSGPFAWALP